MQIKPPVALVSLLISACLPALSQLQPVVTQYERQKPVGRRNTSCKNGFQKSFDDSLNGRFWVVGYFDFFVSESRGQIVR